MDVFPIDNGRIFKFVVGLLMVSFYLIACSPQTIENPPSVSASTKPASTKTIREPKIEITPASVLMDEPIAIQVSGLLPQSEVTIRMTIRGAKYEVMQSWAMFQSDSSGLVDITTQVPITGTYNGVDPMGLFWSMENQRDFDLDYSSPGLYDPRVYTIEVWEADRLIASTPLKRYWLPSSVIEIAVTEDLPGARLFLPGDDQQYPVVITLGGSDGGGWLSQAIVLASHGYAALSLPYFGRDGLPVQLVELPLEYFKSAIDWLQTHPNINGERIAVYGISRGGELALLLGATYPEIKAVIGVSASGMLWPGIPMDTRNEVAAWSLDGEALPFLPRVNKDEYRKEYNRLTAYGEPIAFAPQFLESLETQDVGPAVIPVENIQGPVLLISGGDDAEWPSVQLSEVAVERLKSADHPFEVIHLVYPGAGHNIGLPYRPTTGLTILHPHTGELLAIGGNPQDTARANLYSWNEILDFLERYLILSGSN